MSLRLLPAFHLVVRPALICSVLSLLVANQALAFQRSVTHTGPQGNTTSRQSTATRTANGYSRQATATGPQGGTVTRSSQGQWDPATKTWSKAVTTTGPQGQIAQKDVNLTRTANGYNRQATVTGPQGGTATRSSQGQWDPATKTWSKAVTTTGGAQ